MTRMFGMGDDFGDDAILGRLEGMKDVIEQVNKQFKDPVRISSSFCFVLRFIFLPIIDCTFMFYIFWVNLNHRIVYS